MRKHVRPLLSLLMALAMLLPLVLAPAARAEEGSEETIRTTLGEAVERYSETAPKGEFVLVVEGGEVRKAAAVTLEDAVAQVLTLKSQGMRLKDAAKEVAEHTGLSKNELYAAALEQQ